SGFTRNYCLTETAFDLLTQSTEASFADVLKRLTWQYARRPFVNDLDAAYVRDICNERYAIIPTVTTERLFFRLFHFVAGNTENNLGDFDTFRAAEREAERHCLNWYTGD